MLFDAVQLRGLDPRSLGIPRLTVEIVTAGPEILVYFLIDDCGATLFGDDPADPAELWDSPVPTIRYLARLQLWTASWTTRFGVSFAGCLRPLESEDYQRWYRWWKGYVSGLSPEQFLVLDELLSSGSPEVAVWRPKGTWKKTLSEAFATVH